MAAQTLTRVVRRLHVAAAPRSTDGLSDRELLDRYLRRKDEAAFAGLVSRHERTVLGACRHVLTDPADVSDAFQATFLVLLQNARRVTWHSSLGGWLFAVAHRVAVSARRKAVRRTTTEGRAASRRSPTIDAPDLSWREACEILHEELDKLRDTYRLPLLFCYLDGLPRDEAAKRLGLSVDAVRGRLDRGREKLRDRLARRGVTLSVGLFAALAGTSVAAGTSSHNRIESTVAAARGGANPRVSALVHGSSPMILTTKSAIVLAVALAAIVPLGLGAGQRGRASGKQASPGKVEPPPAAKTEAATHRVRVLSPDGKPLPGARLIMIGHGDSATNLGVAGSDGRFALTPPKNPGHAYLVASADGYGIDFIEIGKLDPNVEVELRMVPDLPLRGRVIDTEGKPVAGASVRVNQIGAFKAGSLDRLLDEWKKLSAHSGRPAGDRTMWYGVESLFSTETDKEGRFEFRGLGAERFLAMRIGKPGITDREEYVANRKDLDPKLYNLSGGASWMLNGGDPTTILVEREKLIRGRVTEKNTGKPRAGVHVILSRRQGGDLLRLPVGGWTNKDGYYEIRGARKAGGYMVEVKSDPESGHMACQGSSGDTPGYDPITINLEVKKGVIITGRMFDKSTGDAVVGFAMAGVLVDNPFAKEFPTFDSSAWFRMHETDKDGRFRVVTIPGPVILMGGPNSWEGIKSFKRPVRDPKYPKYFFKEAKDHVAFYTSGGAITPVQGSFGKVLEIKADATEVEHDIELEPANALEVKVHDVAGTPVPHTVVAGQGVRAGARPRKCEGDSFQVYRLDPGKPRLVVCFEPKRKQVGTLTLKGDEKNPIMPLGPPGSAKGRLLSADGKPAAGVEIAVRYSDSTAQDLHALIHKETRVVSDDDGRFTLKTLIPGVDFRVGPAASKKLPEESFRVRHGHESDLGDVKLPALSDGK